MDTLPIIFTTVTILGGLLLIFGIAGIVSYFLGFRDPIPSNRYDSDTSLTGSIDHE